MSRAITKELLRELGDWRVDKEARELIAAGRVSEVRYDPPILTGKVGTLTSSLKLGDGPLGIENQCPCRQSRAQGKICAHVVALVYA